MSKPVYEIPISGDEGQPAGFPPPARDARPRNLTTAPPPSASGHAPTYPATPAAPFTSAPPTIAPEGGWPAAESAMPALPPTPGLTPAPEIPSVFNAPVPEGSFAAPALAASSTANFPPPTVPQAA